MADAEPFNLLRDKSLSPKQAEALALVGQFDRIILPWGRRCGKTDIGAYISQLQMWGKLGPLIDDVAAGRRRPWAGIGKRRAIAAKMRPDARYWCVAPTDEHLDEIRGHLLEIYSGEAEVFLHPDMGLYRRGRELWLLYGGVCCVISFIPAARPGALVGKGLIGAWIDESGLISNDRYAHFKPSLWDQRGTLLATGTPEPREGHFFTKLAVSGLREGEERYDPSIAEPDPRVRTLLANTIDHAYLQAAREEAANDALFLGPAWKAIFVDADWRRKSQSVYDEWVEALHVADVDGGEGAYWRLNGERLPEPDRIDGMVDWGWKAPGAAVVAAYWADNPLDPRDPRPLVIIADDRQKKLAYTLDGWWGVLHELEDRWGGDLWKGDPNSPNMIEEGGKADLYIEAGPKSDKEGRIRLVAGLLHHDAEHDIKPALYVSSSCEHTPRQFDRYQFATTRQGEVTDRTRDYDDHCLDCVAMGVVDWVLPSQMVWGTEREAA